MKNNLIRIATRVSPLALWQANFVKAKLHQLYPTLEIEIIGMTTKGDKLIDTHLSKVGGKGLFIKELEDALLNDRADIAVHSMKDMTVDIPPNLGIAAICEREIAEDALVCQQYPSLMALPSQSCLGTSSLRRKAQVLALRPDLKIESLRGNINTRLSKLAQGDYDAIILAAAGLKRLGYTQHIREILSTEQFLPAIGQGALGIECVQSKKNIWEKVSLLDHFPTRMCLTAERAINQRLFGGCSTPIAGFAVIENTMLQIRGLVASPDGRIILKASRTGDIRQAEALGYAVADELLAKGAETILQNVRGL